jgi:hypothetical protein
MNYICILMAPGVILLHFEMDPVIKCIREVIFKTTFFLSAVFLSFRECRAALAWAHLCISSIITHGNCQNPETFLKHGLPVPGTFPLLVP